MAPKRSSRSGPKRETKHGGKNGKKDGLSGSSFFTWFMVIALLGVWTSVAVVWFDLVDYEEVLAKAKDFRYNLSEVLQGKLGVYDADGDGDFDVEDAKILLGQFTGGIAKTETTTPAEEPGGVTKTKTKAPGLKERSILEEPSEDSEENGHLEEPVHSDVISDQDLADAMNVIHEQLKNTQYDIDDQDLADAVEEIFRHSHHDNVKDLDLEDALEADVHESLHSVHEERSEPVDEEPQSEDEVISDNGETEDVTVDVEEPIVETRVEESATELEEPVEELEPEEVEPVEEQHTESVTEPEEDEVDSGPESLGIHDAEEVLETEEAPEQETLEVTETGEADVEETVFEDEPDIAASENTASEYEEPEAPVIDDSEEEDLNLNENVPESEEPVNEDENKDFLDDENTQGAVEDEYTPDDAEEEPQADELADTPEPEEEIEEPTPETPDTEAIEETELSDLEETLYDSAPETEEEVPVAQEDLERDEAPSEEELYRTEEILHAAEEQQEDERLQEEQIAEESNEATEAQAEDVRTDDVREDNTLASEKQVEEPAVKDTVSDEKKEKAKKKKPKLLNKFDKSIKAELDAAEKLRKKGKVDDALKAFEGLVNKYPESPKARYGKAQSEDDLAEKMRSNEVLLRAINTYGEVAELPSVPSDLAKLSLKRRANRQQFLGRMRGAVVTLQKLVQLYPDDISLRNDLGVGYLLLGDNNSAKQVYEEVLSMAPNNGFAKVHYGFILKAENKVAESIPYLKEGLESGEPGTDDGRFYFHLGDAMQRVGDKEAYQWYETGHKRGHFASVWQRSLYNVNGLKAQPWWTAKETGYTDLVRTLEANWKLIRDEGLAVMDKVKGLFVPEDENLREKGDWSQYTLWQQGRKNEKSCNNAPRTCSLLERFPESTGCRRGQIKYSVMHPGTHVWPHTGPTNCRLRMHLGLVIPKQGCKIRCANDTRSWEEGKVLVFDDSFEHEVWQDADSYRLIFIVDVWHPELTPHQRRTLPAI